LKLLIVAPAESVHTARWTQLIADEGWDVHLFPAFDSGRNHGQLTNVTVHHDVFAPSQTRAPEARILGRAVPPIASVALRKALRALQPDRQAIRLAALINALKPDILHAMELQGAGYLTLAARDRSPYFPRLVVSNWGSDIFHFAKQPYDRRRLARLLAAADSYKCECERDVPLARDLGFDGHVWPVFPNSGGFNLQDFARMRETPPSRRKVVMLKGYHGWAGRALVGLEALARCSAALQGYEVVVYSADDAVAARAGELARAGAFALRILKSPVRRPFGPDIPGAAERDVLEGHAAARLSIGLSITDGASTSFLEALALGSFPIQSGTACADEWIEDGRSGILVAPEDVDGIANAVSRVLADDALVDQAAQRNWETARRRLDRDAIRQLTIDTYKGLVA
jgi:glycosyltransferase involved in cell wall biosynthesis